MSNSTVKQTRKEIKAAVAELLPTILTSELFSTLQVANKRQLEEIHKLVVETLARIDTRQKDVQSLIMSQIAAASVAQEKK